MRTPDAPQTARRTVQQYARHHRRFGRDRSSMVVPRRIIAVASPPPRRPQPHDSIAALEHRGCNDRRRAPAQAASHPAWSPALPATSSDRRHQRRCSCHRDDGEPPSRHPHASTVPTASRRSAAPRRQAPLPPPRLSRLRHHQTAEHQPVDAKPRSELNDAAGDTEPTEGHDGTQTDRPTQPATAPADAPPLSRPGRNRARKAENDNSPRRRNPGVRRGVDWPANTAPARAHAQATSSACHAAPAHRRRSTASSTGVACRRCGYARPTSASGHRSAAVPGLPVPVNGLAVEIAANMPMGNNRFEIRLDPARPWTYRCASRYRQAER